MGCLPPKPQLPEESHWDTTHSLAQGPPQAEPKGRDSHQQILPWHEWGEVTGEMWDTQNIWNETLTLPLAHKGLLAVRTIFLKKKDIESLYLNINLHLTRTSYSQIILQKSMTVVGRGPWVAMYALGP